MEAPGIHERISQVVKSLGKKQVEFARDIGVTTATASTMLSGKSHPSTQTKMVICRAYGVNPHWLDTGEGDMWLKQDRLTVIAEFFKELSGKDPDSFEVRLISVLASMPSENWAALANIAERLAKGE